MKKISRLTLERGPCFGACPVYRVTVDANGKAEWVGEAFVASLGPSNWDIPLDAVVALEHALARAGFEDLGEKYTDYLITDMPSAQISVVFDDGTKKTIEHYQGDFSAPRELTLLENQSARILKTRTLIHEERSLP